MGLDRIVQEAMDSTASHLDDYLGDHLDLSERKLNKVQEYFREQLADLESDITKMIEGW